MAEEGPGFGHWFLLFFCSTIGPLLLLLAAIVRRCKKGIMSEPLIGTELAQVNQSAMTPAESLPLPAASNRRRTSSIEFLRRATATSFEVVREASKDVLEPFKLPTERAMYKDIWRSLSVILVCITHHNEIYAEWNVGAVQQWVLPFLTIVSGSLYAQTRCSLLEYVSRLATYFSIGAAMNGAACIATGGTITLNGVTTDGTMSVTAVEWHNDFPMAVLFQMAFLILFMGGAIVAAPLKMQLDADSDAKRKTHACMNVIGYVLVLLGLAVSRKLLADGTDRPAEKALAQIFRVIGETFVGLLFAVVGAITLPEAMRGVIGWVLVFWVYGTRVAIREQKPGSDFHVIDVYIWAFVVQKIPLMGQAKIGSFIARMWPFFVIAVALILVPGSRGRNDQLPFDTAAERLRQYVPELILVVGFVCVPAAGPNDSLPFLKELRPHMEWLNTWSLAAFVGHKAIYYLIGYVPGLIAVLSTAPLFAALHLCRKST